MNGEKNRIQNEQSFYRLQLDFNTIPNFPVDKSHEFYGDTDIIKKKLDNTKDEFSIIQNREKQLNGNYSELISSHSLIVEDFFNDNSKKLFEQIFLQSDEDKIEQLFLSEEAKANINNGKRVA